MFIGTEKYPMFPPQLDDVWDGYQLETGQGKAIFFFLYFNFIVVFKLKF